MIDDPIVGERVQLSVMGNGLGTITQINCPWQGHETAIRVFRDGETAVPAKPLQGLFFWPHEVTRVSGEQRLIHPLGNGIALSEIGGITALYIGDHRVEIGDRIEFTTLHARGTITGICEDLKLGITVSVRADGERDAKAWHPQRITIIEHDGMFLPAGWEILSSACDRMILCKLNETYPETAMEFAIFSAGGHLDVYAEPEFVGTIKWDGCINYRTEKTAHICQPNEFLEIKRAFEEVTRIAANNLTSWFE